RGGRESALAEDGAVGSWTPVPRARRTRPNGRAQGVDWRAPRLDAIYAGARRAHRDMSDTRPYLLERVGEAAVVQIYADGFRSLPLRDRILTWHLYLAALAGRDIYYDQRYAHNLAMRDVLEAILRHEEAV